MTEGIKFQLQKITTDQFATINSHQSIEYGEVEFQIEMTFAVDSTDSKIDCTANIKFESKGELFIIIIVKCSFSINVDSLSQLKAEENVTRLNFLRSIANITIGATRGILHSRTESTVYNKFHLPLIDIALVVPDDISIDF